MRTILRKVEHAYVLSLYLIAYAIDRITGKRSHFEE